MPSTHDRRGSLCRASWKRSSRSPQKACITIDGARVTVTERGRPYVRIAAAAFDAYLPATQKRHSIAV